MWVGTDVIMGKSRVAWLKVCTPRKKGGMNIIGLQDWSNANLVKNLWNLQKKADSLWIQWVHAYYVKGMDIMSTQVKQSTYWIMKAILKLRNIVMNLQEWDEIVAQQKLCMSKIYHLLKYYGSDVEWRWILMSNVVRPCAMQVMWVAYNERLPTKDRLSRLGLLADMECVFRRERETLTLYGCAFSNGWNLIIFLRIGKRKSKG